MRSNRQSPEPGNGTGATERRSDPSPRGGSVARTVLRIGLALCLGAMVGSAVYLAPLFARDQLTQRLRDAARARGLELEIGAVYLDPLARLVLDDVQVHDRLRRGAPPLARLRRLEVHYDVDGPSRPKVYLRDVRLYGLHLHLSRDKDGQTNLDGLLEWLANRKQGAGTGEGGGLRRYLSNHVPDFRISGLSLSIDDDAGPPIRTPAGIDLRHLRMHDASLKVLDLSPVRETVRLRVDGATRIEGLNEALSLRGELVWPDRSGWVTVRVPPELTAEVAGFRAGLSEITARSDGRVSIEGLKAQRVGTSDRGLLALTVRKLQVRLAEEPVSETVIPERLRKRLPSIALRLLRHITEVSIHEPVIAGVRPEESGSAREDEEGGGPGMADRPSRRKLRKLLPRATLHTRDVPEEDGKKPKRSEKAESKAEAAPEPVLRDGSKVRNALVAMFSQGTDGLEAGLADLRRFLAAQPVGLLTIHHGKARYRDDRSDAAPGEVSDFNARVERMADTGMIEVALDFDVPGRKVDNKVSGRVDPRTGDTQLSIRMHHLPLAPYAALAPPSVTIHGDSAIRDTRINLGFNAKDRQISLEGKASVTRVDISLPPVSRHLINDLSFSTSGRLLLDLKRERLALEEGKLQLGKVWIHADGSVERYRVAPAFDLKMKVPTVDCQDAVDSLVNPIAPMLYGMRCSGNLSFRFDLSLDTADMDSLKFDFVPMLQEVRLRHLGRYIHFNVLSFPFEHHARQADDSLYTFITGPGSQRWASLPDISEYMTKVVNTTEDGAFWTHTGFLPASIRNAMVANLQQGRFVRGASTISQQVVKNLFFVEREKTLSRKIQEAVITWEMERTLEKEQIMELYFNIIEFGPRVYGIRAAANHYFNREPRDLSLLQCLWLGSIIPGPRRYYKHFTEGKVADSWEKYLCRLGDIMVTRERITPAERQRLKNCRVIFGGGNDGSEQPASERRAWGLGHEGAFLPGMDPEDIPLPEAEPGAEQPARKAPSAAVDDKDQP